MGLIAAESGPFSQPGARSITRATDGDLHCFWTVGGNIRYAYGSDGGGWTLVGDILVSGSHQSAPAVCTDGVDCHLAWLEAGKVHFGYGVGGSWTDQGIVSGSFGQHKYVALARNNTGRLYLAFVGMHLTNYRDVVFVFYSDTDGASWTLYQTIESAVYSAPASYSIGGSTYVTICIDNDGDALVAFSRDDASSWRTKLDCRGAGFWGAGTGEYVPSLWTYQSQPNVAIRSDGTVHIVYVERPDYGNRWQVYHVIKDLPGATSFRYVGQIAPSVNEQSQPQIVVGNDGRVYCCWQENPGGFLRLRYAYFIQEYGIWIDLGYLNTPQGFSEGSPRARWGRWPASDSYVAELNVLWAGGGSTYHTAAALPTVAVSIVSPNGGQVWGVGSQQQVRWAAYGASIDHLELDYSTDSGSTWTPIESAISATATSYDWTIPSTPSDICKVRVVAKDGADATIGSGESMHVFSIGGTPIATILVQVRSGPDDGSGGFGAWEAWRPVDGSEFTDSPRQILSTVNEYVQWKIKFESSDERKTPVLR